MNLDVEKSSSSAPQPDPSTLRGHLTARVSQAQLERDPFCHIYIEGIFPTASYLSLLEHLPAPSLYSPLNLRLYSRGEGESTRDQFYLTAENLAKLPAASATFWKTLVRAVTDGALKRSVFTKLAPDLAERFEMPAERLPDMDCTYDVVLFRDTQDYRIKPHPDGLNKIVTMQFYLPADDSNLELGTSLYRRRSGLFDRTFDEAKRFPFKPNSAYAFAVSDSAKRRSWHGRDRLTGFAGVRNTLMVLFQRESPRDYAL